MEVYSRLVCFIYYELWNKTSFLRAYYEGNGDDLFQVLAVKTRIDGTKKI